MRYAIRFVFLLPFASIASAEEGMFTLDNLPVKAIQETYGFAPDREWADHVMRSSVRLVNGCSGSVVSKDGLVLTNHHCVRSCVTQLSSKEKDYVADGFLAETRDKEMACPAFELNRLEEISDVTEKIRTATAGKHGKKFREAQQAEKSRLESECATAGDKVRCDVVELYGGGVYHLYRYTRFQDVRLVFVPEDAIAFFGGDPDNFNFPRYNLDMALLRAWEDGKPLATRDFFPINPRGAKEGELTFMSGHPGSTQRLLTISQLETERDIELIPRLIWLAEYRGVLRQYSTRGAEEDRIARDDLTSVENTVKAYTGMLKALQDPAVFDRKRMEEQKLREAVAANPQWKKDYGSAWDDIAAAQKVWRAIEQRYKLMEIGRGFYSDYFAIARTLVRGAAERPLANEKRLTEFTDARLPRTEQRLMSPAPIYPEYEKTTLAWSLSKLREELGPDDAFVKRVLGKDSPEAVAARLVDGTRLGDVELRKALWEGGTKAVRGSKDPFIALLRDIDDESRAVRKRYEEEVEAVEQKAAEQIAAARFGILGTGVYPDATFTLRLTYGAVKGWEEKGKTIKPFTTVAGLYPRATGAFPFALPASWLKAKGKLDLKMPMNFVTTNDIIGGNSGSPVINKDAEIVGLVFDGNIHSLGGAYWFDDRLNRAVSVHSGVMLQSLQKIYGADSLVRELSGN